MKKESNEKPEGLKRPTPPPAPPSAIMSIAGKAVSLGQAVVITGKKRVYAGRLLKPKTWFKFDYLNVIEPIGTDHIAIIGTIDVNPIKHQNWRLK